MSLEFLITSIVVVLIPGTGVIYTISNGIFMGKKAAIAATIGCTFGIVPHLLASIFGLAALLHTSAVLFQFVKFAGVAYLLYLAYSMWKETGSIEFEGSKQKQNLVQIAMRGFLINILNPKLSIFFLAFLPQFIDPTAGSTLLSLISLGLTFMGLTFIVFLVYGFGAHHVRHYIAHNETIQQRLQKGFAATLALLGLRLAMEER